MTKTRVLAALVMAPLAIAAILLLPTPWLALLAAVVFLGGLWEWFDLADVDDSLQKWVLLIANLGLMVAIVWSSRSREGGTLVLYQIAAIVGIVWWALALLWLGRYGFGSNHESWARALKLAAGTLAVVPAWCALTWLHADGPNGHRWLLTSLAAIWAADTGAYFAGRSANRWAWTARSRPRRSLPRRVRRCASRCSRRRLPASGETRLQPPCSASPVVDSTTDSACRVASTTGADASARTATGEAPVSSSPSVSPSRASPVTTTRMRVTARGSLASASARA